MKTRSICVFFISKIFARLRRDGKLPHKSRPHSCVSSFAGTANDATVASQNGQAKILKAIRIKGNRKRESAKNQKSGRSHKKTAQNGGEITMKTYWVVHFLTLNQGVQGSSPWRRTKELFLGTRSLGDGSFFVEKNRCKTSVLHQFQHGDGRFKEDDIIVHGCVMAIFAPVVR